MANTAVIAYIPALHAGYKKLFEQNNGAILYIAGQTIIDSFRPIQKDVRALDPQSIKDAIEGWNVFSSIEIIEMDGLQSLNNTGQDIVMPDEDISHELAHNYLKQANIKFSPIFLRWDRRKSNAQDVVTADLTISNEDFDKAAMNNAYKESKKSSDIWRRVGAVLLKDDKVVSIAHNQSTPTLHSASILGDPRNNYNKGTDIDKSIFMHAEAKLIAEAAKNGTKLDGADLYVTTFPCPTCAKLIAFSGIKKLLFTEGYAVLDGENLLKTHGVQLIKVDLPTPEDLEATIPYPEK